MNNNWNIDNKLASLLTGHKLIQELQIQPQYDSSIVTKSAAERLLAMNTIYDIYLPSEMSLQIYTQLYLAMYRSIQKKTDRIAMEQRLSNASSLRTANAMSGIIGGTDEKN